MFLDLFFPNRCLACEEIISANAILCDICEEKLSFSHFKFDCENPLAQKAKLLFPIEQAYALFIFKEENLARNLLHRLKYGDQEFIGKHFSHWIFDRISITNIDEIVSVPLHPKKLKKRGYNQLTLLGNELGCYGIRFVGIDKDGNERDYNTWDLDSIKRKWKLKKGL